MKTSAARSIPDIYEAVEEGTIPGEFVTPEAAPAAPRSRFLFPRVESVSRTGASLFWEVFVTLRQSDGEPDLDNDPYVEFSEGWLRPQKSEAGEPTPAGVYAVVETKSWQGEGEPRAGGKPTLVLKGKNLGRKNETTPAGQAIRDAYGLWHKRARKVRRVAQPADDGGEGPANGIPIGASPNTRPFPMLVKREGKTKLSTIPEILPEGQPLIVQTKLDGLRLSAYLDFSIGDPEDDLGGTPRVVFYSRTGVEYPGLGHLRASLAPILAQAPPVPRKLAVRSTKKDRRAGWAELPAVPPPAGAYVEPNVELDVEPTEEQSPARVYLDGELYLHGLTLQEISGLGRGSAAGGEDGGLEYHVYDCFFPSALALEWNMPGSARQSYLDLLFENTGVGTTGHGVDNPELLGSGIRRVANYSAATKAEALALADGFLAEGYEGAIARFPAGGYEYGTSNYHSDALVKLKPVLRDEFPIIGYLGGKRGKDVGAVIWVASAGAKKFNVVPKDMSYADRYKIFAALEEDPGLFDRDFAGLLLTVEYADRTKAGVPAQAKAIGFRGRGATGEPVDLVPEDDPVAKILAAE